jgi:hypothetical protein
MTVKLRELPASLRRTLAIQGLAGRAISEESSDDRQSIGMRAAFVNGVCYGADRTIILDSSTIARPRLS